MVDSQTPAIRLQLDLSADQPGLLEGLEAWLRLGLISEAQVLALAQAQLACALPPYPILEAAPEESVAGGSGAKAIVVPGNPASRSSADIPNVFPPDADEEAIFQQLPPPPAPPRRQTGRSPAAPRSSTTVRGASSTSPPRQNHRPPAATEVWLDRLMSELSVVWLLGLGVFLVVLSSAVLAATQWARFNAVGQYLVLLSYTVVFGGAGAICERRANLQLTAKTLQMITLLLVPLNFWAMDALGVWGAPGGLLLGVVAALVLSAAAVRELRHQRGTYLDQGHALGLAYLHTGWSLGAMPIVAVYLGVVASTLVMLYQQLFSQRPGRRSHQPAPASRWHPPTLTAAIALGLLVLRAFTVVEATQWGQFGLALGLYAATWVGLGQRRLSPTPQNRAADSPSAAAQSAAHSPDNPAAPSPRLPLPLTRWPILLGRLILLWSWLITITDWLAQALGISVLGLGLRVQALRKLGKRRDLLAGHVIAIQLGFVGWELLPAGVRQSSTTRLLALTGAEWWPTALLGISLFPYVIGLVALGDGYYRRQQPKLGRFSDGLAMIDGALLTLVSAAVGRVLVINLIASTVTAFVLATRRTPRHLGRILLSYGLALATILVTTGQRWPQFPLVHWLAVVVALAVLAILLSNVLPDLWGKGAWIYGLGLSALTYGGLWWHLLTHTASLQSPWTLLGLAPPLAFTLVRRHRVSAPTTALALLLTLGMPWTRLVGLATAVLLSAINGAALRQPSLPFVTVAYGLGLVIATVDYTLPTFPRHWTGWYVVVTALALGLWAIWRILSPRPAAHPNPNSQTPNSQTPISQTPTPQTPTPLSLLYRDACDQWGHLLTLGLLVVMTAFPRWPLVDWEPPTTMPIIALGGLLLALALRYGGHLQPRTVYLAGWAVQLLVAEGMAWRWGSALALAVPTLGLGAMSLALAMVWSRSRPSLATALQHLTLAYAGLALFLRSYTATAWTGWLVLGASLLVLEIGRRSQQPLARWIALLGLSVGWYELVLYQLLQAPAGAAADGLIVLAAVAALIMGAYRLAAGQLRAEWGLPQEELLWAAHLHWGVGSLLLLSTGLTLVNSTATLVGVGIGVAAGMVLYALLQGRLGSQENLKATWVYLGLAEWVGWFALVRLALPGLAWLDGRWGMVACAVAVPVYWMPWSTWGWPQRPWRTMAITVPLLITLITQSLTHVPTLWVLVGFYGWLAWHSGRVRVSYLSVASAAWAVWLWLDQRSIQDPMINSLPLSLTLLYIAQIDPGLKTADTKGVRHWLRVGAVGLVLVTALVTERWTGWPVGLLSLGLVAVGLWLRIRAFLYVSTLVFALNALNQLVLLNAAYPFIKWVLGFVLGVALIWIAADFERRRSQWLQMTQTWLETLDGWQ